MNPLIDPVRAVFKSNPAPRPVVADLCWFPEVPEDVNNGVEGNPQFWTVRLYRDNFDSFSGEDRLVIFNWVSDTIKKMRIFNPNVWVEVFERVPNER